MSASVPSRVVPRTTISMPSRLIPGRAAAVHVGPSRRKVSVTAQEKLWPPANQAKPGLSFWPRLAEWVLPAPGTGNQRLTLAAQVLTDFACVFQVSYWQDLRKAPGALESVLQRKICCAPGCPLVQSLAYPSFSEPSLLSWAIRNGSITLRRSAGHNTRGSSWAKCLYGQPLCSPWSRTPVQEVSTFRRWWSARRSTSWSCLAGEKGVAACPHPGRAVGARCATC